MNSTDSGKPDEMVIKKQIFFLRLIFFGVQLGMLSLLILVIVINNIKPLTRFAENIEGLLKLISATATGIAAFLSILIRFYLPNIFASAKTLEIAVKRYFPSTIVILAACEAAAIFSLIIAVKSEVPDMLYLFFGVSVIAQWFHFPSQTRIVSCYDHSRKRTEVSS